MSTLGIGILKRNKSEVDFCFHSGIFLKCARFLPEFLLITRPDSAQIFTKMSPDEELVTLHWQHLHFRNYSSVPTARIDMPILGQKAPYYCDFGILPY